MNKMDSSAEESALTYSRDIYAVMNDEPIYDEDVKKFTKHHSKKTSNFVEQVQPISYPLFYFFLSKLPNISTFCC